MINSAQSRQAGERYQCAASWWYGSQTSLQNRASETAASHGPLALEKTIAIKQKLLKIE